MQRERSTLVDGLRGLAMLGVVAIHLAARVPADSSWQGGAQVIDHFGRFGVPLFLAVLGWGAAQPGHRRPVASLGWLGARLRAVLPAYLVWALLYAVLAPWDGDALPGSWQPGEGLGERLWRTAAGYSAEQLWYMPAYLSLLPLVALVAALPRRLAAGLAALALVGMLALLGQLEAVVAADTTPPPLAGWILRSEGRLPLPWIGFVAAGALLAKVTLVAGPRWLQALRLAVGLAGHVLIAQRTPGSPRFDDFWCSLAMPGSLLAFLLWAPVVLAWLAGRRPGEWLAAIGRNSLAIYLGHVLFLRVGWAIGAPLGLGPGLALAALTTAAGCAVYLPVHKRLFAQA